MISKRLFILRRTSEFYHANSSTYSRKVIEVNSITIELCIFEAIHEKIIALDQKNQKEWVFIDCIQS